MKVFIHVVRTVCALRMRRLMAATLTLATALGLSATAQAGAPEFDVTFGAPTHITQGSSGFVPVFLNSNDPGGATLNTTGFQFLITPNLGVSPRQLAFTNSPPPGSDPTFANPNYVFFGNSANVFFNTRLATASTTTTPNDTIVGGDSTAPPFSDITVGTTPVLLGDLPITTATGIPPIAGDSFSVSLVPPSGVSFTTPPANTGFTNSAGFLYNFFSSPGTVIIDPAVNTTIPEPSTLAIVLLGGLAGIPTLLRRWKRAAIAGSIA